MAPRLFQLRDSRASAHLPPPPSLERGAAECACVRRLHAASCALRAQPATSSRDTILLACLAGKLQQRYSSIIVADVGSIAHQQRHRNCAHAHRACGLFIVSVCVSTNHLIVTD